MTMLLISPAERARLRKLRAFAEERGHWRNLERDQSPPGDDKRYRCALPAPGTPGRYWRVVFSVDVDPMLGPVRHLSVSVAGAPDRAPNAAAMIMIGEELGIRPPYLHLGMTEGDTAIHLVAALGEPS